MDPAITPLGKMLLEEITPVVMVLRTPLVEEACIKNGLSFVQMLEPFCVFNNIDVPVRTANDQPYRLQKFKLRLFYTSDVQQPNFEVAKGHLEQVITRAGEGLLDLHSDPPQIEHVLTTPQSELLPSWFQFFNKELVRTLSFSDHEALDHPVACLLVVSSNDEEPINKFVDLFNTNQLPILLNDGIMDPKILKHYLLVHDSQEGSLDKETQILNEMKNTFGSNNCSLLSINSSQDGSIEHRDDPWYFYKTNTSTDQLGCFLSTDDFDAIKDFMQDLSSQHIIPHMEQKIRMLNQQVSTTRKGFRNQIKNLWWRKGKEETPDASDGPSYTFNSIESQIRVLGDYAFMLRDYELALSNYRLLSTDYKLDKAWKRYAGVQEMTGLTYFMLDQSIKESEYCMESALNAYLKSGPSGLRNSIRCGLWWAEMLKTRNQFKEAAGAYFRVLGEEPLHSAVMLEQASYCYLFSRPPMLRKYAFHLVLAGDMYKRCNQIKHAIRSYKSALSVYEGITWNYVNDHVHFHIGKWYALLGMFDVAVAHLLEVLACGHQPRVTQELFLRDFHQIVQKTGKTFEVSKLQLPVINMASFMVIFQDHRTYASSAAVGVRESLWKSLEVDMIPSVPTVRTNWLETQAKLISKNYKELNICVAGESMEVNVEFKNPLQIPISITGVSLVCELSEKSDGIESGSTNGVQNDVKFQEATTSSACRELDSDAPSFTLSEADLSLGGGETIVVRVTVTPKIEGILKIIGVRWRFSGSVVGFRNFNSGSVNKKLMRGKRKPNCYVDCLNFVVVKSIPKLEGSLRNLPRTLYLGDIRHTVLELRNLSEFPVKNMKMKISDSRFLSVGRHGILNTDFPACLEKKEHPDQSHEQFESNEISQSVFSFPEDTSVQGGTHFLWPLWFRAAVPGSISLYVIIYYEMGIASSVMKYRTFRMYYNLEVFPSLDVSFQISPCPSKLQDFIVRMEVVNRSSIEGFQVHQLSAFGSKWELSLIQPLNAIFPSQYLTPGQALSCFFELKNGRELGTCKETDSGCDHSHGSDVNLGISSSRWPLLDVSCSPLVDFHNSERFHSGVSNQGCPVTVDFILISRPQKSGSDPVHHDAPLFLSHHACHCSVASKRPIWWVVDGCRTIYHDFSVTFCEVKLKMIVHNPSDTPAVVRLDASDSMSCSSGEQSGWQDASPVPDIKTTSSVKKSGMTDTHSWESVPQFMWVGSSSNRVKLEPKSRAEIPLCICVFCPGTIDLSGYELRWNFVLPGDCGGDTSGTCRGDPCYITVLQSPVTDAA